MAGTEPLEVHEGERFDPRAALIEGWREFLNRWRWEWFVTLTFGNCPTPERADKTFRLWVSKLNRHLYGSHWSKSSRKFGGIRWARATELQKRGSIHYHVLMGGDGLAHVRRLDFMDHWTRLLERRNEHGVTELSGISRIHAPRSELAVSRYCAKYTAKGFDIDLCPRLSLDSQGHRQELARFVSARVNTPARVAHRVDLDATPAKPEQPSPSN